MRTKIVVNCTAGRGYAAKALRRVKSFLARYGVEHDLVATKGPGHGVELARQAAEEGYDRVVAMGGDGTAAEVASGLLQAAEQGHQVVLGLIPVGSGNDFSYAIGIPSRLEAACRRLVEGRVRSVDVIRATVDGRSYIFENCVGIGYNADVLLETQRLSGLRGFPLYLWAALRVLVARGKWPYPVRIVVDGERLPHREVTAITIGNGPRTAGGFFLTPQAEPDDGLLDVCVADRLGRLGILGLLPHALIGLHEGLRPITLLRGRHVSIESERGLPGHIDGEVLCTQGRRIEFEILPGRLKVWC